MPVHIGTSVINVSVASVINVNVAVSFQSRHFLVSHTPQNRNHPREYNSGTAFHKKHQSLNTPTFSFPMHILTHPQSSTALPTPFHSHMPFLPFFFSVPMIQPIPRLFYIGVLSVPFPVRHSCRPHGMERDHPPALPLCILCPLSYCLFMPPSSDSRNTLLLIHTFPSFSLFRLFAVPIQGMPGFTHSFNPCPPYLCNPSLPAPSNQKSTLSSYFIAIIVLARHSGL